MRLVLIHGMGQRASVWDATLSCLKDPGRAVCPDLYALLGGQDVSYPHLYRAFSDDCARISGPLSLCGLSLGGVLALRYAVEHPGGVQALLLAGTQYKMPRGLLKLQNAFFRLMPEKAFAPVCLKKEDAIYLTSSMRALDFSGRLRDISCVTLVACGEKDSANKKAAENLAQAIPRATLHMIKNAGHEVNTDAPKALAALLDALAC